MNWEVTWWMGLLVRAVVTIAVLAILFRLLRDKFTTARVSLTIGALVALGALWLANIEGASRLVFLGLEIDRRVESAQAILKRLEAVDKKASETTNQLIAIQTEASQTKEELNNLISREQRRFEIQRLEHAAINGDRKAYESLRDYQSEDSEFSERAAIAHISVKRFYIGATKIKGLALHRTRPDGERVEEKDFTTEWLIEDLKHHSNWRVRARAAELLGNRREIGVPEPLLDAMETDGNLWVCKEALDSFEKVTEFKASDIFQFETGLPRTWYQKQRQEINVRLKKPEEAGVHDQ